MAKVFSAEAALQVSEAHVAVAEAGMQRSRAMLDGAIIKAPFDGVITHRYVDAGAFSQGAGQGNAAVLLQIARTDRVVVEFLLAEALISKVRKGSTGIIQFDALPNQQFEGKVSRSAQSVEGGSLRLAIDLANSAGLLPGFTGTVTFKVEQPKLGVEF